VGRAERLRLVVLRDAAAEDDPRSAGEPHQQRVQECTADVVQEDVHTAGRVLPQRPGDVLSLIVDGRVEAQVRGDPAALLRPAGDPDDLAALDLGDLTGTLPTAPAAPETTTVSPSRRQPTSRTPKYVLGHAGAVRACELLDPEPAVHMVADRESWMPVDVTRPTAPASIPAPIATGSR